MQTAIINGDKTSYIMNKYQNKVKLLHRESSLEFLPNLSNKLGPKIYMKRDDQGGRGVGGNKLRKYERIIGDALAQNCDTLIIAGHIQSNAARELVASACQLGLKSIVVCKELIPSQNETFSQNGNALLMNLMSAEIVTIEKEVNYTIAMNDVAENVKKTGGKPYIIPFGGSNLPGALGYVDCAIEIVNQFKELNEKVPSYLFLPTGSGGTQAGLVAGFSKIKVDTKVIGISVLHKEKIAKEIVENLTNKTIEFIEAESNSKIYIDDNFIGQGYGEATDECLEAIKLLAQLEGLFLCPVYGGKAMAGLISHIKTNKITSNSSVLFIHTGGSPLVYAYYDKLFEQSK